MAGRCQQCGQPTEWSPDVGSAVCTACGTLEDASQSVLTTHADFTSDAYVRERDFPLAYARPSTLKSLRSSAGWDLAGQGKEARNERNKLTMHEFIRSLATRLAYPGLTPRAQVLFDLAMDRAALRWGRAAKLAAGAALAFALREAGKADALHDIAYLLSEPPLALTRTLSRLLPLLGLTLPKYTPTAALPSLVAHLTSLLASPSPLPPVLQAFLRPLLAPAHVPSVLRTAEGLLALDAEAPAPALLVLALEGHARPSRGAPHLGVLSAHLGARTNMGKGSIMERVHALGEAVLDATAGVPWLACGGAQEPEPRTRAQKKAGRAKVPRRTLVARAVVDVVQFRAELWRRRVEEGGRVEVRLETDEGEDEGEQDEVPETVVPGTTKRKSAEAVPRRKRPRTAYGRATSFLLDPLGDGAEAEHTAHLLAPDAALGRAPTRLQLLCAVRGGEARVPDEELFGEGEMEGLVLDEGEGEELRAREKVFGEMWGEEVISGRGTEREGLAELEALVLEDEKDEEDKGEDEDREFGGLLKACVSMGGEIVEEVGEWRPASPGGGGWEDQYEM